MKKILGTSDLRNLLFLEYLYVQDDWVTLNIVAESLECSSKSLRKDIPYLNEKYKPFKIETSVKKGIRLSIPPKLSIDYIYSITLKNSLEYKFLELIFFSENLSRIDLEVELYISSSTVTRILNNCSKNLNKFDINITSSPYSLTGNEKNIQQFFFYYFSEKYLSYEYPFNQNSPDIFKELISIINPNYEYSLENTKINLISMITIIRFTNGHTLVKNIGNHQNEFLNKLLNNDDFLTKFKKNTGIYLSEKLVYNLMYMYEHSNQLPKFHFNLQHISSNNTATYTDAIEELLYLLKNKSVIYKTEIPMLKKELIKIDRKTINHLIYNKYEWFIIFFKKEHPNSIHQLEKLIHYLFYKYSIQHSDSFIYTLMYTLITNSPKLVSNLHLNSHPIDIGIISDFGATHLSFLKNNINDYLKNIIHINSINYIFPDYNTNEYDLVLITNSTTNSHPSIISINPFPNNSDWNNIKKSLNI